jgi:hypothetical protein
VTDGAERAPSSSESRQWWLASWMCDVMLAWRERRVAQRTSIESLRLYRDLEATQPQLTGVARYQEVVARRTGLDQQGVREVLQHAEDSFASWPVERPLRFRDVVEYLVATECLNLGRSGARTGRRLTRIIAGVIPENL